MARTEVLPAAVGEAFIIMDSTVAFSGYLDIQPPSGQQWLVFGVGASHMGGSAPTSIPDVNVFLYNGADYSFVFNGDNGAGTDCFFRYKLAISNEIYMKVQNTNPNISAISAWGIRIK